MAIYEASAKQAKQCTPIFWRSSPYILVYFVVSSYIYLSKFRLCLQLLSQQLYTRVLLSDDRYQTVYNENVNIQQSHNRKKVFQRHNLCIQICDFFFVLVITVRNFFYPQFSIRIRHPPSAGIRSAYHRHPRPDIKLFIRRTKLSELRVPRRNVDLPDMRRT